MKKILFSLLGLCMWSSPLLTYCQPGSETFALHPQNSHYFSYKGKPTILITSAEHYGAILNTDFDYKAYLQTLAREGMNYTRIFTGSYVEVPGAFGIGNNTLAPAIGSYLTPWMRTDEEGLFEGEKKVDLTKWNPAYFERLLDFVELAQSYEIIVEVTLFCSTYTDGNWERGPFNPQNNINGIPEDLDRKLSNTPQNGNLLEFQKNLVAKIVRELNAFDNVFYEIQNEPWADDPRPVMRTLKTLDPLPGEQNWFKWAEEASPASLEWQQLMAQVIVDTEASLPNKHLIAQNFTNFKHSLSEVDPHISILNFHYAWPETVWMNEGWDRPISYDESGFAGSSDSTYLRQAWQFILAGGAVFNNLDYSFYVGEEGGKGENNAPGGGSATFRKQLTYLHSFMESLDYLSMSPDHTCIYHAPGLEWYALSEEGKQYGIVFHGKPRGYVRIDFPLGTYRYEWISPYTGEVIEEGEWKLTEEGTHSVRLPKFEGLIALSVKAN